MKESQSPGSEVIKVSEHFYSLQGEGRYSGYPAVFLRLSGCVLKCAWCDTIEVWKTGTKMTVQELYNLFLAETYLLKLWQGNCRLVITGGDPLIWQTALTSFLDMCSCGGVADVETEGVLAPTMALMQKVHSFVVSPKLSNSGVPFEDRIVKHVLVIHKERFQDTFKFPVLQHTDIFEVTALVKELRIDPARVWLMPVCSNREEFIERSELIASLCKEFGFNFSPRLQLLIWNKATGV